MLYSTVRRFGVLGVTGALIGAGLAAGLGVSGPAVAAPGADSAPTPEAVLAADWVAGQLSEGTLPVLGQTIDFGVGLAVTGAAPGILAEVKAGIDDRVADFATTNNTIAKAAWFYALVGDPTAAGTEGIDLLGQVEALTDDDTGALGGDWAQQWFGTLALVTAGSDEAARSVEHLVAGQCEDGGWGWSTPCAEPGDQFATFYSLAALAAVSDPDPSVRAAIANAVSFLTARQSASGGFETCTEYADDWSCATTEDNANDTGLAAWSLGLAGATEPARRAAEWVAAHQIVSLAPCAAATPADGAIAWTSRTLPEGVSAESREEVIAATTQALAGLAYLRPATANVTGPTGYVRAGRDLRVAVTGLRAGQPACVGGLGAAQQIAGPKTVRLTAPAGSATRTVTVSHLGGSASVPVQVLGKKKLKFTIRKKKVRKGNRQRVVVRGLAPGERVTVRLRKKVVGSGTATKNGRFGLTFRVTGKVGKAKVRVRGEFPAIRKNDKRFRVLRKKR